MSQYRYPADRFATTTLSLTNTGQRVTFTNFRVVELRAFCATAWLYADALAGTYNNVAANGTVVFPVLDAISKIWFKHASTGTLEVTLFGYSTY